MDEGENRMGKRHTNKRPLHILKSKRIPILFPKFSKLVFGDGLECDGRYDGADMFYGFYFLDEDIYCFVEKGGEGHVCSWGSEDCLDAP